MKMMQNVMTILSMGLLAENQYNVNPPFEQSCTSSVQPHLLSHERSYPSSEFCKKINLYYWLLVLEVVTSWR
jgi:hypothetical protein